VFKSVINNTLKDFPKVECLHEEQKDCIKNVANRRCLSYPPYSFWKEFYLLTLSTIINVLMNGKGGTVSMIMMVCLALGNSLIKPELQ